MQRILPRGEIEGLDHTAIPRVRMPVSASVFIDRAARLRHLASDSAMADYLLLMANLADGQHSALKLFSAPAATEAQISRAQAHGMPPMPAIGAPRDPVWQDMLGYLLDHLITVSQAGAPAVAVFQDLKKRLEQEPDTIEAMADALLADDAHGVDAAVAPLLMAALQVYWTGLACRFNEQDLPVVSPFGVCPCCGSLPVASVVRVGGPQDGCRYMSCPLCATEWHMVRVTCSHCEDTKEIAYHSIEGGSEAIRAESCDHCHGYRKIFYQEKDLHVEPVADDLASIALDVLMGEAGYLRANGNPLLWQSTEAA